MNPRLKFFCWGVSAKRKFGEYPWSEKTFYGIDTADNNDSFVIDGKSCYKLVGRNGSKIRKRVSLTHFLEKKVEVDIYLDVDQGILRFCVVGVCDEDKEVYIEGLRWWPWMNNDGWVPHFLFCGSGTQQQIRACSIDIECYGKELDIQWDGSKE